MQTANPVMRDALVKAGLEKAPEYDNRFSGAVFPYSDEANRGPFILDNPAITLDARLTPGNKELVLLQGNDVVARGQVTVINYARPFDPAHEPPYARCNLTVLATGEVIPLVAWKKHDEQKNREFLQLRKDTKARRHLGL